MGDGGDVRFVTVPSNFHRWRWAGVAVWIAVITLANIYGIVQNRRRTEDIQTSRQRVCLDQNENNRVTKATLARIVIQTHSKANIKPTLLLIDALAPVRDCSKL